MKKNKRKRICDLPLVEEHIEHEENMMAGLETWLDYQVEEEWCNWVLDSNDDTSNSEELAKMLDQCYEEFYRSLSEEELYELINSHS